MVSQREFSAIKKLVISVSTSLQGKAQSFPPFPAWPSYELVSDHDCPCGPVSSVVTSPPPIHFTLALLPVSGSQSLHSSFFSLR